MEKVIWIINQYASHLETRHLELSTYWASRGYIVGVITSSFHHGKCKYIYDEKMKVVERAGNVKYFYLHSGPSYSDNGAKRILNMLDFCSMINHALTDIVNETGEPSFVIASSAPPFVWNIGYKIAKKYNAKFIAEFRDIWPLSLIEVQGLSKHHPLVHWFSGIEKKAYKRADAIVSTMPYAWKHVCSVTAVERDKVHWFANGINVEETENLLDSVIELPRELNDFLEDHWCCIYIGSIVKSECLEFILEAFSELKSPDIYMAIVGEGHEKNAIQKLAGDMKLANVHFFPAITRQQIPVALSKAKACLAAHKDIPIYEYGLSMYKLNDYMLSGKPTVFACGYDNVVKEAKHFSISMEDSRKMADAINQIRSLSEEEIKLLAQSSQKLIKEKYDYPKIGKAYLEMMEGLEF